MGCLVGAPHSLNCPHGLACCVPVVLHWGWRIMSFRPSRMIQTSLLEQLLRNHAWLWPWGQPRGGLELWTHRQLILIFRSQEDFYFKEMKLELESQHEAGDLAQWCCACLVSSRSWVWSPMPGRVVTQRNFLFQFRLVLKFRVLHKAASSSLQKFFFGGLWV